LRGWDKRTRRRGGIEMGSKLVVAGCSPARDASPSLGGEEQEEAVAGWHRFFSPSTPSIAPAHHDQGGVVGWYPPIAHTRSRDMKLAHSGHQLVGVRSSS